MLDLKVKTFLRSVPLMLGTTGDPPEAIRSLSYDTDSPFANFTDFDSGSIDSTFELRAKLMLYSLRKSLDLKAVLFVSTPEVFLERSVQS